MAMNCKSKKGYRKGGVVTKMTMHVPKMGYKNGGVIGNVAKDHGVDTIDAKVRPGEYMLNPEAVKFIGGNDHANGVRQLNALVRQATGVEPGAVDLGSLRGFVNSGAVDSNMNFFREAANQRQAEATAATRPTMYVGPDGAASTRDLSAARDRQAEVRARLSGTPRPSAAEGTASPSPSTDSWTGRPTSELNFRGLRGAANTAIDVAGRVLTPLAVAGEAYSVNRAQKDNKVDLNNPSDALASSFTRAGAKLAGPAGAVSGYYASRLLDTARQARNKVSSFLSPSDAVAATKTPAAAPSTAPSTAPVATPAATPAATPKAAESLPLVTNDGIAGLRSGPTKLEPDRPVNVGSTGNGLTLTAKDTGAPVGTISSSDNPEGLRRIKAGLASVGNDLGKYGNKLSTYDSKAYGKARLAEIADGLYYKAIGAGMSPEKAAGLSGYAADIVTNPEKRQAYIKGITERNKNAAVDKAVRDGKLSMKDVLEAQMKNVDLQKRKLERQQSQANLDRTFEYTRDQDLKNVAAVAEKQNYDRNKANYKQAQDTVSRITAVPEMDSKGMPTGRTREDPVAAERYMQQAQQYVDTMNEKLPPDQRRDIRSYTPEEWRTVHKFLEPNINLRDNLNREARKAMGDLAPVSNDIPNASDFRPDTIRSNDVFDKNTPVTLMDYLRSIPARDGTYEDTVLRDRSGKAVGRLDRLARRPDGGIDKDLLRKFGYKG